MKAPRHKSEDSGRNANSFDSILASVHDSISSRLPLTPGVSAVAHKWSTFGLSSEQEDCYRKSCFTADLKQSRIFILLSLLLSSAFMIHDYAFWGLSWRFYFI